MGSSPSLEHLLEHGRLPLMESAISLPSRALVDVLIPAISSRSRSVMRPSSSMIAQSKPARVAGTLVRRQELRTRPGPRPDQSWCRCPHELQPFEPRCLCDLLTVTEELHPLLRFTEHVPIRSLGVAKAPRAGPRRSRRLWRSWRSCEPCKVAPHGPRPYSTSRRKSKTVAG